MSSFDNVELSDARTRGNCPEPCAVCGDASSGYHYDVPSCNGCKTFFRRTIIANRQFECHKDGKCQFDKDVRCACRACRFRRCVEVGMNAKAIQFVPNPTVLGKKRKLKQEPTNVSPPPVGTTLLPKKLLIEVPDSTNDAFVKRLVDIELKCEYLRTSNFPASNSLLDLLTKPCALDDITKYTTLTSWKFGTPMENIKYWIFLDLTIFVEYAKTFETFREISLKDKCALIQQVSMACVVVHHIWDSAVKGHERTVFPCGFMPFRDLPCPRSKQGQSNRLMEAFARHDFDRTQYALIRAICFFNSDCYELSDEGKKKISIERQKCLDALFNYTCTKYGSAGPGKFGMTLALLPTVFDSAEQHKDRMRVREILRQKVIEPFLQEMVLGKDMHL